MGERFDVVLYLWLFGVIVGRLRLHVVKLGTLVAALCESEWFQGTRRRTHASLLLLRDCLVLTELLKVRLGILVAQASIYALIEVAERLGCNTLMVINFGICTIVVDDVFQRWSSDLLIQVSSRVLLRFDIVHNHLVVRRSPFASHTLIIVVRRALNLADFNDIVGHVLLDDRHGPIDLGLAGRVLGILDDFHRRKIQRLIVVISTAAGLSDAPEDQ